MGAYLAKWALIWYREILSQSLKSRSQWGSSDICKSTFNLLAEVPAGSRINFEGPAFASKAILKKNTFGCCGQPPSFIYTFHWMTLTFEKKKLIIPLSRQLLQKYNEIFRKHKYINVLFHLYLFP